MVFTILMIPIPLQIAAVAHSLKQTEEKTDAVVLTVASLPLTTLFHCPPHEVGIRGTVLDHENG